MQQALTEWPGDVASLITEMKRRAGVRTDQQLAKYMGAAQSTVSNWRKRGTIPEAAILQYERAVDQDGLADFSRMLAARVLALRLPELYYQRLREAGALTGRRMPYSLVAYSVNAITVEIDRQLKRLERETGKSADELVDHLLEDHTFLGGVLDWVCNSNANDMLAAEAMAIKRRE